MQVPFIDLKSQRDQLKSSVMADIDRIYEQGSFVLGSDVFNLESELADYAQVAHCLTTSSGTDALIIALMACGIKPGQGVIIPNFTFSATASAVSIIGAIPILVDVDEYYHINPSKLDAAKTQANEAGVDVAALMSVDLFGHMAQCDRLWQWAKHHGIYYISDAAQSFGSQCPQGKVGQIADITAVSFYPTKPFGGFGDGGCLLTNDAMLFDRCNEIRGHGGSTNKKNTPLLPGMTARLDSIKAAIMRRRLTIFDAEIKARQSVADRYTKALKHINQIELPICRHDHQSVWACYVIASDHRQAIVQALDIADIGHKHYYPQTIAQMRAFTSALACTEQSVSTCATQRLVALPMSININDAQISYIAKTIESAVLKMPQTIA